MSSSNTTTNYHRRRTARSILSDSSQQTDDSDFVPLKRATKKVTSKTTRQQQISTVSSLSPMNRAVPTKRTVVTPAKSAVVKPVGHIEKVVERPDQGSSLLKTVVERPRRKKAQPETNVLLPTRRENDVTVADTSNDAPLRPEDAYTATTIYNDALGSDNITSSQSNTTDESVNTKPISVKSNIKKSSTATTHKSVSFAPPILSSLVEKKQETEALVLDSLATMMELAGTLPEINTEKSIKPGSVVEAKLEFTCMDPDEFAKQAQDENVNLDINNNSDKDSDTGKDSETDDDDSLWGLMGNDDINNDDDDDDNTRYGSLRAFYKIHTALQQWITPHTVNFVKDGTVLARLPGYTNDIIISRCAGLQATLEIHMNNALRELGVDNRKKAQLKLVPLLYTFDYSRQALNLDSEHTRALTNILLVIAGVGNKNSNYKVPPSCKTIGMLPEEYKYLTQSAVLAFKSDVDDEVMPGE